MRPARRPLRIVRAIAGLAILVVVLDQLSKAIVVAWIGPGQDHHRWELAGRLVAFQYVENTGAAFGILAGQTWLLSIAALVIAIGFLIAFWSGFSNSRALRTSVGLILGGALGNLLDRLRFGYVVDFLAIGTWPKFNIADSAITVGLVLLTLIVLNDRPDMENRA